MFAVAKDMFATCRAWLPQHKRAHLQVGGGNSDGFIEAMCGETGSMAAEYADFSRPATDVHEKLPGWLGIPVEGFCADSDEKR